ncbi:MAG TPA: class I lanthipeptide [Thermoanaerobaculia bacterium]|jgi:hypothetical protein|nr:class I lanthipeptide [Thermoanaerobaculia bacterium]
MKKPKTPKKLTLSRETLRNLHDRELQRAAGGVTGVVACHSQGQNTRCTICPGCTI